MIIIIVSSDYNNFPHSHIFIYFIVIIFIIIIITYNYRLTEFMPKKKIIIISTNTAHSHIINLRDGNY